MSAYDCGVANRVIRRDIYSDSGSGGMISRRRVCEGKQMGRYQRQIDR